MSAELKNDILSFPEATSDPDLSTHDPESAVPSLGHASSAVAPNVLSSARRLMRIARIRLGRLWHAASLGLREGGIRGLATRLSHVAVAHPRKTAITAGCLIVAVALLRWKSPDESQTGNPSTAEALTLDEVTVFPPETAGAAKASKDAAGNDPVNSKLGNASPHDRSAASPFPERMPVTPRAAWLIGTIEAVRDKPVQIQPTSHIEIPMYSRRGVAPVSLREIERRRRNRR